MLFFISCIKENENERGLKPLYLPESTFETVTSEPAKAFNKVGKIFKLGNTIYISDRGTGVHIIDNSNPSLPTKQAFITINGSNDVAVKNNIMYADNGKDLLAIDISNINDVALTARIENVYENTGLLAPPNSYFGYFECVDNSKGVVYEWVLTDLKNPKCRR